MGYYDEPIDIEKLRSFVDGEKLPMKAGELARLAHKRSAPAEVVLFLESIDPEELLDDQEDILTRAEEASLLRLEKKDTPTEDADELELD